MGLVARTIDPELGRSIEEALLKGSEPETLTLTEWRREGETRLRWSLGLPGAELAYRAMKQLVGRYPGLLDAEVKVYSPCVEGVGDYAVDDGGLRVAEGVYVAGDACGRFRGIVASMVSGRYVAERLLAGR